MLEVDAIQKRPSTKNLNFFFERLDTFHVVSDELKEELALGFFEIEFKAGSCLLKRGNYCKYVYFVLRGIITGHAISKDQSITSFIAVEGDFISAIDGLYGRVPSTEDMRVCEDSLLIVMHVDDLERVSSKFLEMNIAMMKIIEGHYLEAHHRSVFFRIGTSSDKYAYFLRSYPHHALRIPIKVVASFLNVKINTLKNIVNKCEKKTIEQPLSKADIESYLEDHQPYLQKKLSLSQLAKQLKLSPHTLSRLLNLYFNQNFSYFINGYRVNFVLKKLADQKSCKQYSLDGLGTEAGFSSRSTFFNEFKKHTGVTPLLYLKEVAV